MPLNLKQEIEFSSEILSQEIDGETVILDLKSECYFGLDPVATRIWQLVQQTGSLQQTFDTVLDEYEIDETTLKQDFSDLLRELSKAGLITLKPALAESS